MSEAIYEQGTGLKQSGNLLNFWYFALFCSLLVLGGCTRSKDNTMPPSPLMDFAPQQTVKSVWNTYLKRGNKQAMFKLVPLLHEERVYVASSAGEVAALQMQDGQIIWKKFLEVVLSSGPSQGEGIIFLGGNKGEVIALSAENGTVKWQVTLSSEVLAAPQVQAGKLIVRTGDGKLFALNSQTGERVWVHERSVPVLSLRGTSSPVLTGDLVIAGLDNGQLICLNVHTGNLLWELNVAQAKGRTELERMVDIDADPVLLNNELYVTSYQGRTVALDIQKGKLIWEQEVSSHIGLAVDEQAVYISDSQSQLWALSRNSGSSLWKQSQLQGRQLTAPTLVDNYLVVGDYAGYLHWLSRETGQFAGRFFVGNGAIQIVAAGSGRQLLVYDESGEISLLQPSQVGIEE